MEVNSCLIIANLLNILHRNYLTINIETLLSKFISDNSSCDRTVSYTCSCNLCCNSKSNILKSLTLLFSCSLKCFKLFSLLLHIFSQLLPCCRRSYNTFACRNKIVTTVAILHINDIVLVSKSDNIFFKYNFHVLPSFLNYFIKSAT